jgi:hypothetical protein
MRGLGLVAEQGGDDRCDRREAISELAPQAVGHHPAVGHAGRVDPPLVHRMVGHQLADQRADEADVVHAAQHRLAAAMAGIPGEQAVREAAGALGIDHDEALALRLGGEAGRLLRDGSIATASVQHQDERQPLAR